MQTFLKHAPRWVALLSYTALALVLAYVGAYATLYRVSMCIRSTNVRQLFARHGLFVSLMRTLVGICFRARRLFCEMFSFAPISKNAPDLTVAEMKIGIAWQSLWGNAVVEKLVLDQAQGKLYRTNQGKWNVSALMQAKQGISCKEMSCNVQS